MSLLNYVVTKLKSGIITFINAVILANRDYPYHDFHTNTMKATDLPYRVGEHNRAGDTTQSKLFTSKSTLIYATTQAIIKLNSAENVEQTLLATHYYEFLSNVQSVFYRYASQEGTIYIWTEGVLGNESRSPHN